MLELILSSDPVPYKVNGELLKAGGEGFGTITDMLLKEQTTQVCRKKKMSVHISAVHQFLKCIYHLYFHSNEKNGERCFKK